MAYFYGAHVLGFEVEAVEFRRSPGVDANVHGKSRFHHTSHLACEPAFTSEDGLCCETTVLEVVCCVA